MIRLHLSDKTYSYLEEAVNDPPAPLCGSPGHVLCRSTGTGLLAVGLVPPKAIGSDAHCLDCVRILTEQRLKRKEAPPVAKLMNPDLQYRVGLAGYDGEGGLWWSNANGWGDIESADVFSVEEIATLNLPDGGEWRIVNRQPERIERRFISVQPETAMEVTKLFSDRVAAGAAGGEQTNACVSRRFICPFSDGFAARIDVVSDAAFKGSPYIAAELVSASPGFFARGGVAVSLDPRRCLVGDYVFSYGDKDYIATVRCATNEEGR